MVILCRAERFDPRNSNHSKVHTIMQLQGNNGKAWFGMIRSRLNHVQARQLEGRILWNLSVHNGKIT